MYYKFETTKLLINFLIFNAYKRNVCMDICELVYGYGGVSMVRFGLW